MRDEQAFLTKLLCRHYGDPNLAVSMIGATGGDIHQSAKVNVESDLNVPNALFAKLNNPRHAAVLAAEYQALSYFQKSPVSGYYPIPIAFDDGKDQGDQSYCGLIMEYLDLTTVGFDNATRLGSGLAKQHSILAKQFGWESDNFIGTNPQKNQWTDSWPAFFSEQRLAPQLVLATQRGLDSSIASLVESVINNLPVYFDTITKHQTEPSLLHGDLWGGNLAVKRLSEEPVFYDPAPYFGDPEVDIAMTKLFGRLPESFYTAYHAVHPVREGAKQRAKIYDLYHLLNHFNLFGASYESAISSILRDLND